MNRMLLVATGFAALALAGCGGGKGGQMVVTPPPMGPPRLEDQFGAGFGLAFRVDRNAEPGEPTAPDVESLTLAAEPREIP